MAETNMNSQRLPINGGAQSAQNGSINGNQQNLNETIDASYNGSIQQMLAGNTGYRVVVDFLVGSTNIVRKEGILYLVGLSYIVLYDDRADTYTLCNLYSIEFVTFLAGASSSQSAARTALKRV